MSLVITLEDMLTAFIMRAFAPSLHACMRDLRWFARGMLGVRVSERLRLQAQQRTPVELASVGVSIADEKKNTGWICTNNTLTCSK